MQLEEAANGAEIPLEPETPTPTPHPDTNARYRRLSRYDAQIYCDHLLRLSPDDRHMRFLGSVRDDAIRRHCATRDWSKAIVIGAFIGDTLRGVGEMVRMETAAEPSGEVALSVEADFQNSGVGTELLRRVLVAARNRYVERLHMYCLSENRKMRRIASRFEAELEFQQSEIEGRIWPPWPTYASVMEEAVGESIAFFNAVFHTKTAG